MARRIDAIAVLAVALCAVVAVGEALTYLPVHSYSASAEWDGDGVSYTAESSGSDVCDAVLIDNGDGAPVTSLIVYLDDLYDDLYAAAAEACGVSYNEQEGFANEVSEALSIRSFDAVTEAGTDNLLDLLESTLDDPAGVGLLVSSYALPASVYDGTADCLLVRWVEAGGTLYWATSEPGRFYADGGTLVEVEDNQVLLLGCECLNLDGPELADGEVDNAFLDALTLKNSGMRYAADVSGIEGSIEMGYSAGGYASVAGVPLGSGAVFVFSGEMDFDLVDDIAQVVAAGITLSSEVVCHESGVIEDGELSGRIDAGVSASSLLYVYVGGTFAKYGEAFNA